MSGSEMLQMALEADEFEFAGTQIDGAEVALHYRFGRLELVERFVFPAALRRDAATDRAVRILHLIAGVSYYKVVAPRPLRIHGPLDDALTRLVAETYDHGLRELAVANDLPVPLPVKMGVHLGPGDADDVAPLSGSERLAGALVPVGGGKDSALVAHLVPDADLMTVNPKGAQQRLARRLGRPLIEVHRHLDPLLRELNEAGATNGHVPVTAIVAAASVCTALVLGRRDVVFGNERSASEPTRTIDGYAVNHQWSKSLDAERLLADAFEPTGVRCFSLLRPLSEAAIARSVSGLGLVGDMLSCNHAFTIWRANDAADTQTWCGDCSKCRFAYLILAPHTPRQELVDAFGRDLLDDPGQTEGFRDLFDVSTKPFECVGSLAESAISMAALASDDEWRDAAIVRSLSADAAASAGIGLEEARSRLDELARPGGEHLVPVDYLDRVMGLHRAAG